MSKGLAGTVTRLLQRFGQPAVLVWVNDSLDQRDAADVSEKTLALIQTKTVRVEGDGLVSQTIAILPQTKRSPSGARLTVGKQTFKVGQLVQQFADGGVVYQEVVLG